MGLFNKIFGDKNEGRQTNTLDISEIPSEYLKEFDEFGFKADDDGAYSFVLTDEEESQINILFKQFEGMKCHPDYAEDIKKSINAFALFSASKLSITYADFEEDKTQRERIIKKCLASICKAYSYYQHPGFLYFIAYYIEKLEKPDEAKAIYQKFINKQLNYEPKLIDSALTGEMDLKAYLIKAKEKIKL